MKKESNTLATPPKTGRSRTMIFALLGGAVAVLGACCVCGGGGLYFFSTKGKTTDIVFRDGVFEDKAVIAGEQRYKFKVKANTGYWASVTDHGHVHLRAEPADGGPVQEPKKDMAQGQLVFYADKEGEFSIIASYRKAAEAMPTPQNNAFSLTIREVDAGTQVPRMFRLPARDAGKLREAKKRSHLESPEGQFLLVNVAAFSSDSKFFLLDEFPRSFLPNNKYQGGLARYSHPDCVRTGTFAFKDRRVSAMAIDQKGRLYVQFHTLTQVPEYSDVNIYDGLSPKGLDDKLPPPLKNIRVNGGVKRFLFSPDMRWLYFLDLANRRIGRIDTETQVLDKEIDGISAGVTSFCLTPNGKKIYCCANTNQIDVIDATTLVKERTVLINQGKPRDIAATDRGMVYLAGEKIKSDHERAGMLALDLTKGDEKKMNVIVLAYNAFDDYSGVLLSKDQRSVFFSRNGSVFVHRVISQPNVFFAENSEHSDGSYTSPGMIFLSPDERTLVHDLGNIYSVDP